MGLRRGTVSVEDKRVEVTGHGPGLFESERAAERRHDGPAPFQNDACQLGIGARRLPAGIGEVGHTRHVPNSPTIVAVATQAVARVEAGDDPPLLVGTAQPVPVAFPLNPDGAVARGTRGAVAVLRVPAL